MLKSSHLTLAHAHAHAYTLPRHNLPIYSSSRGRAAALQIACVK
ncbi:MAG: hypothetical protein WAO71_06325 [Gallionella sp.]